MFNEKYVRPEIAKDYCENIMNWQPFVVFDTETTGVKDDDEIIEAGVIDRNGNEVFHSYFRPEKMIDPGASKVNGITNADLADSPTFKELFPALMAILEGVVIVGHNVDFDIRLLKQTAIRYGLDTERIDKLKTFDTLKSAKALMESKTGRYRLNDLCKQIGNDREEKHEASYDCLDCMMLLRHLNKLYKSANSVTEKSVKNHPTPVREPRINHFETAKPMILAGKSTEEIAETLGLATGTIEGYICKMIDNNEIKATDYVSSGVLNQIANAASALPNEWDGKMRPLKEALPEEISYLQIRIAYKEPKFWSWVNTKRREAGYSEAHPYSAQKNS